MADGHQADAAARGAVLSGSPAGSRIKSWLQARKAATVVVVPSPCESLSLLALESFAVGTPIPGQRPQRGAGRSSCRSVPASTTPTATSSAVPASARRRQAAARAPRWGATAAITSSRTSLGRDPRKKYERMFTRLRRPKR